jgi:putative MATE family efflux protein
MAGSMMIGFAAGAAFNLVDTYFVSRLGTEALAAMGYTFPLVMGVFALAMGVGVGTASVVSRAIGAGDRHRVQRLTADALLLGLLMAAGLVAAGLVFLRPLLRAMGGRGETLALARQYMTIWLPGVLFVIVPMVGNNAIRATGDTLTPSLIMAVGLGLNTALDPLLIFGLGPFPAMGIRGAAVATVISRAISMTAAVTILALRKRMLTAERPHLRQVARSWRAILYIALPTTATNMLIPLAVGILTNAVSRIGTPSLAAFSAGLRLERFAVIPMAALGVSATPFIGQNWGAGRRDRARAALRVAWVTCFGWGGLCVVVLAGLAWPVAGVFSSDPAVRSQLRLLLLILPLAMAFHGIIHTASGAMNAINRPLHSAALSVVRLAVLQVPLALLGASLLAFGGLLGGIVVGEAVAALVAMAWLRALTAHPAPAEA